MTIKRLIQLLRYTLPYRRQWLIILTATVLGSGMTLLHPWPMKILIDQVFQGQEASGLLQRLLAPLAGISTTAMLSAIVAAGLLIFLINSISDVLLTRAWIRVGQGMVWRLAGDLYARLQRRSLAFHSRNRVGDSMSRITGDCWCVHTLADSLIFAPATALILLSMMLFVMLRMDPGMTVLSLAVAPFMVGGAWLLKGPVGALAKARREIDSRMQSHVQQTLAGIPVVQAFTQERREHERFKSMAESALQMHRRATVLNAISDLSSGLITTLGTGAVLLVGGYRVVGGHVTLGELLVFLAYLRTLQTQLRTLVSAYLASHELNASVNRVMEVLDVEPEVRDAPDALPLPEVRGHVRLESIRFGYDLKQPVLSDVSLEVHPGETIAIVGPTGAGKSTLVNLIPRLFDPWAGRVSIDGHDVREFRLKDLRRQIAVVPQEPVLFPVSIAENIAYARPDASRQLIRVAAQNANAEQFIERLEHGYDTVIGERGATLSGGERQRIAIARALLMDAPILILDEPTSSLDVGTESLVVEALDRLMSGRTTFVIAHRLSTIRNADRIVVLDRGEVVESGTHTELLLQGGLYSRLYDAPSSRRARDRTVEEVTA